MKTAWIEQVKYFQRLLQDERFCCLTKTVKTAWYLFYYNKNYSHIDQNTKLIVCQLTIFF